VETDSDRLEKGEINLSDLAQSEASLAGAEAKLIAAQNNIVSSKANFEKIISKKPTENIQEIQFTNFKLPQSLAESYKISENENPDLKIAILEHEKSQQDVVIARSDLAPSATLSYKIAEQNDFSSTIQKRTQQTLKATATWPLYSGGSNLSSLRKAKELENKYDLLLQYSKKTASTAVANAWSSYQSSKGVLNSIRSQVKAAEIANEGITLEYESGESNRTTLDVIQSHSILLDAKINLATSERNFLVSQFSLLSVVGRLTSKQLNLNQ
jgi:outer membrane protein